MQAPGEQCGHSSSREQQQQGEAARRAKWVARTRAPGEQCGRSSGRSGRGKPALGPRRRGLYAVTHKQGKVHFEATRCSYPTVQCTRAPQVFAPFFYACANGQGLFFQFFGLA